MGVFNFEGGCYAKTSKLTPETEPGIYLASTQFSSILENVKLSADHSSIDFFDESITENGRASYPLNFIADRVISGRGNIPKNILYLSADAFGVLPPVSLLTPEQAMDFFVLGYSAKLAGTEIGVKVPQATFSSCFGAPFMLRHPEVYSQLLKGFINKHNISVWMINTGWFGGSYGNGTRYPLQVTRSIIRQIQAGQVSTSEFVMDEIFQLKIPAKLDLLDPSFLIPENSWNNKEEYLSTGRKLALSFQDELKKIKSKFV